MPGKAGTTRKNATFSQPPFADATMVKVKAHDLPGLAAACGARGETMDRSLLGNRCAPARRSRQFMAGTLCLASFVAGQMLFGQEPAPQVIVNPFVQPSGFVRPANVQAVMAPQARPEPPRELAEEEAPLLPNKLRPAAITAVDVDQLPSDPLAPVVGSTEAARRNQPRRKAEPLLIQNTAYAADAELPAGRHVEAKPLPLNPAAASSPEDQAVEPALAPIV